MTPYRWARRSPMGYEVSSKGDGDYSAFRARLPDGRSLEQHYQCDVKGYDPGGTNWRLGKGQPPLHPMTREELRTRYLDLWRQACIHDPHLLPHLKERMGNGRVLTDMFASGIPNQAWALAILLNERETPP